MASPTRDRELSTSRKLPHPPEAIFAAFADPEVFASWWGPKGFTNTFHAFEFQESGKWSYTMHGPDGKDFPNESVFKELLHPRRIVIEHISGPHYILEIDLIADSESVTRLSWVQRFDKADLRDRVAKFAIEANEQNLDRLAAVLEKS